MKKIFTPRTAIVFVAIIAIYGGAKTWIHKTDVNHEITIENIEALSDQDEDGVAVKCCFIESLSAPMSKEPLLFCDGRTSLTKIYPCVEQTRFGCASGTSHCVDENK